MQLTDTNSLLNLLQGETSEPEYYPLKRGSAPEISTTTFGDDEDEFNISSVEEKPKREYNPLLGDEVVEEIEITFDDDLKRLPLEELVKSIIELQANILEKIRADRVSNLLSQEIEELTLELEGYIDEFNSRGIDKLPPELSQYQTELNKVLEQYPKSTFNQLPDESEDIIVEEIYQLEDGEEELLPLDTNFVEEFEDPSTTQSLGQTIPFINSAPQLNFQKPTLPPNNSDLTFSEQEEENPQEITTVDPMANSINSVYGSGNELPNSGGVGAVALGIAKALPYIIGAGTVAYNGYKAWKNNPDDNTNKALNELSYTDSVITGDDNWADELTKVRDEVENANTGFVKGISNFFRGYNPKTDSVKISNELDNAFREWESQNPGADQTTRSQAQSAILANYANKNSGVNQITLPTYTPKKTTQVDENMSEMYPKLTESQLKAGLAQYQDMVNQVNSYAKNAELYDKFITNAPQNQKNKTWNPTENSTDSLLQDMGFDGENATAYELSQARSKIANQEALEAQALSTQAAKNQALLSSADRNMKNILGAGTSDITNNPSGRQASSYLSDSLGTELATSNADFASQIANATINTNNDVQSVYSEIINRLNSTSSGQLQSSLTDLNLGLQYLPLRANYLTALEDKINSDSSSTNEINNIYALMQAYMNIGSLDDETLTAGQKQVKTQVSNYILKQLQELAS